MTTIKTNNTVKNNKKNSSPVASVPVKPSVKPNMKAVKQKNLGNSQIISGYFVSEQSYKQMVIERFNTFLYCVIAILVAVCLLGYYFVTMSEIKLNNIQKGTLALNYDNEEMQNKLDNLQSYYNVDKTVSKTNILQKAQQIMELPAQSPPSVKFESIKAEYMPIGSLGY